MQLMKLLSASELQKMESELAKGRRALASMDEKVEVLEREKVLLEAAVAALEDRLQITELESKSSILEGEVTTLRETRDILLAKLPTMGAETST